MAPPRHDWDRVPTAAEARRWQLLTAGRRAILQHGLDALTVDDVVNAAGLAKGSFYTYYSSRDVFLDALRYALAEDIGDAAREGAAGPWDGIFARMMRASRDWLIDNAPLRALFGLSYMSDPNRATRDPLVAVVSEVLRAGAEQGVVHLPEAVGPTSDAEAALQASAQMVLDVMREAAARAAATHPDDTPIAAADAFLRRAFLFDPTAATTPYAPNGE